jgi:phage gp45-like
MHRATPSNTSFRSYVAGGARTTVSKMDDSKLMQEATANFMKGETRSAIESPQNYGFTSANFGEDDSGSAESAVHFMGGNRSFPVMGPVDDRRHRLKGLGEGDTAMHRGKDDAMQIHLTSDGMYHSAPQMVRCQLVPAGSSASAPPQQQQPQATQLDGGGGNGGGGQQDQQSQNKPSGQQAVAGAGADSSDFMHVKSAEARLSSGKKVRLSTSKDDDDVLHESSSGKDYVGGTPDQHKFSKILTLSGPSINGMGRIG